MRWIILSKQQPQVVCYLDYNMDLYTVWVGDPFGGYAKVKSNLIKDEAKVLLSEVNAECDYFTIAKVTLDDAPDYEEIYL